MSRRNLIKGLTRGKWCHRGHVTQHTKSHTGNESRFIIIIIIIIIIIGSHVPSRNTGQLNKKHVLRDSVPVWPFVRCVTQPLWRPFPRDRLWPSCPYMVSRKWGVFVASTNVLSSGLRSLSKDVLSDARQPGGGGVKFWLLLPKFSANRVYNCKETHWYKFCSFKAY